jgi:hypothetical protein
LYFSVFELLEYYPDLANKLLKNMQATSDVAIFSWLRKIVLCILKPATFSQSTNQTTVAWWCQFLRFTISAHKIAKELGEARARAPVRASPNSLAILCADMVNLRN